MITILGGSADGLLWCTFRFITAHTAGKGYAPTGAWLDQCPPPTAWRLPPPDSMWYPVSVSPYGMHVARREVGRLTSVDSSPGLEHPCQNAQIDATLLYQGPEMKDAPSWRIITSATAAAGVYCSFSQSPEPPIGGPCTCMNGRPASSVDKKVHGYDGSFVQQVQTTSNDGQYYYYTQNILPGSIAPEPLRTSLASVAPLYTPGVHYCRGPVNSMYPWNASDNVVWYNTTWSIPENNVIQQYLECSFHTTMSYVPRASKAPNGHGGCAEWNKRTTTYVITDVRSDSPGRFQIRYTRVVSLEWGGWLPYDYYHGHQTWTESGLVTSLLVLEPGLTAGAIDLKGLSQLCVGLERTVRPLFIPKLQRASRANAIKDVPGLDSNWIENIAGVRDVALVISPLILGYKAVKNLDYRTARKALASAYLAYNFAIKPAISDYGDVKGKLPGLISDISTGSALEQTRRGVHIGPTGFCRYGEYASAYYTRLRLVMKDNAFSRVWNALDSLGLEPSASNLWDLIPFGFVVDWFLRIGPALDVIDSYNNLTMNFDLVDRTETFATQVSLGYGLVMDATNNQFLPNSTGVEPVFTWYDRRVYKDLGVVNPLEILPDNDGLSSTQVALGAALITQYIG